VKRTWKQSLLAAPGIGVALLPKLVCPLCWPPYAGIVSSIGFGFLIGTAYLLQITSAFMILTLAVLAFRAKKRRGFGPFVSGLAASTAVLVGKFYLESNPIMYSGIGLLVAASVWNAWPHRVACRSCASGATTHATALHQGTS
jgi:mercuric ion transport protein